MSSGGRADRGSSSNGVKESLETEVLRLLDSLQHWQTWDLEYEALKEDVLALPDTYQQDLSRIRDEFAGEVLTSNEIDDIFGRPGPRTKEQIINVLDRRMDYVSQNLNSLRKQLGAAENQIAKAESETLSKSQVIEEDGEQITEITEELDEDDNVLSYRLNRPNDALPKVQEALRRFGVADISDDVASDSAVAQQVPAQDHSQAPLPASSSPQHNVAGPKKSVTFVEDTKTSEHEGSSTRPSPAASRVKSIINSAKDHENISRKPPIIPYDEDPEDALLRQEMLKYGMDEVGAVVAELQLEEGGSGEDDDEDFEASDYGSGEDDDEDNYGRSIGSLVTEDYRQRMLELEQRLGIKSRFTESAETEDTDSGSDDERVGRIVIKSTDFASSSASNAQPPKSAFKEASKTKKPEAKGVRFSESLDVAEEQAPRSTPSTSREKEPVIEPMTELVVERETKLAPPAEAKPQRKASRFKKSMDTTEPPTARPLNPLDAPARFLDQDRPTAPTGPAGATIAERLVEREGTSRPPDSNDFHEDDDTTQEAVADEFHKARRKFIQRQGGFVKQSEGAFAPPDEDEENRPFVSRFKAARLSSQ